MGEAPNQMLSHYRLVAKLGEGGMGVVWKAVDTSLERDVALKILPDRWSADPDRLERLKAEAKIVASLAHPNIVTIYSVGESDGRLFIAMEHVDGRSLSDMIPDGGLPLHLFLDLALPLADAVKAAHGRGVWHRDLKPDNVMVTRDGHVKVLDFGLAKLQPRPDKQQGDAEITQTMSTERSVVGTIPYMSPEQVQGETTDQRSDIFSLGVLFYEMVVGSRPFTGKSSAAVTASILRDDPPSPSTLRPYLPRALDDILSRCLQKDPVARYQSGGGLRGALASLHRDTELAALRAVAADSRFRGRPDTIGESRLSSVAILPLRDSTPGRDMGHFCLGLAEDVANALTESGGARVLLASSLRKEDLDPLDAVRTLSVESFLDGSVRQMGDQLRISARLVSAADGSNLRSANFDRHVDDMLEAQDEIVSCIAEWFAKEGETDADTSPREQRTTFNDSARLAYLRGRFFWNKRYAGGLKKAIASFAEALDHDPLMAQAWAGQADCYTMLAHNGFAPARETYAKARAAAGKALELNENLAEVHACLGWICAFHDHDWSTAETLLRRSLELDPTYATAAQWLAQLAGSRWRIDEALERIREAQSLDPISPMVNTIAGFIAYLDKAYDDAERTLRGTLELEPRFTIAHLALGLTHLANGRADAAVTAMECGVSVSDRAGIALGNLGLAHAAAGDVERAREVLRELRGRPSTGIHTPLHSALVHVGLGELEEATRLVGRGLAEGDSFFSSIWTAPVFEDLRSLSSFEAVLAQLKLG